MNKTLSYFKLFTILIFLAVIVWLVTQFKSCGNGEVLPAKIEIDTVFKDTGSIVIIKKDSLIPYKVWYPKEIVLHDTLETITYIDTSKLTVDQLKRIASQYTAKRFYTKTSPVQYGTVTITDTVTQNRITGRKIVLNQKIPEIKETVTLTAPKRIVLYFGIQAIGNQNNIPYASGVTIDLKLKNDAMIGVGGYLTKDQAMYGVSVKFPIRLRKK